MFVTMTKYRTSSLYIDIFYRIFLVSQENFMIGKIVTVTVDRPLGTYHPEHKSIYYYVNYGYIKGLAGGDGEEQDAYVLGITEPLCEFTGKVIAIIHRKNDVEDKFVVAPVDKSFTKDEIVALTSFQEKYFDIEVEL